VIALTQFRDDADDFEQRAAAALAAFAACAGYRRGTLARSTDEPDAWLLLTEWENVGSYRRALGAFAVKLAATPLLGTALQLPAAFESLLDVAPGGGATTHGSDRAEGP
jgi:quinol monooxygenase YgiN